MVSSMAMGSMRGDLVPAAGDVFCWRCLVGRFVLCRRRRSDGDCFCWWCSGNRRRCCWWCSADSRQEDPAGLFDCTADDIDCLGRWLPIRQNLSTGEIVIVPLAINSSAHRAMLGRKSCIDTGAMSTTSVAVSASTSDGSLSSVHGRCGYFLARSTDQMANIPSRMGDGSPEEEGSIPVKFIGLTWSMTSMAELVGIPGDGP
uniref:Uncharacterized protein n=1 Tax=Romanomermis culicivorax TaxID=13658 RepID=A0A915HP69_ROMCU